MPADGGRGGKSPFARDPVPPTGEPGSETLEIELSLESCDDDFNPLLFGRCLEEDCDFCDVLELVPFEDFGETLFPDLLPPPLL